MNDIITDIPTTAEYIMTTNIQSPIQILGVGKMDLRDSKQAKWRKAYMALYTDNGERKKCEINREMYDALHLLYSSLAGNNTDDYYLECSNRTDYGE